MFSSSRAVLDTNVVLSGLLFPGSIPNLALIKAQSGLVFGSEATFRELTKVIGRTQFDRYLDADLRQRLAAEYVRAARIVEILEPIRACRDPRGDKFLEVAVHGRAAVIVTGDRDLLDLHPFRGISILAPADYLHLA